MTIVIKRFSHVERDTEQGELRGINMEGGMERKMSKFEDVREKQMEIRMKHGV